MSVIAKSSEALAGRDPLATLRSALPRNELFAGLYLLGCANGLLGRFIQSASFDSWMGAITGLDINVIVLFACFAGISTLLAANQTQPDEIRPADLAVTAVFLVLVALPIFALSWLAVTG